MSYVDSVVLKVSQPQHNLGWARGGQWLSEPGCDHYTTTSSVLSVCMKKEKASSILLVESSSADRGQRYFCTLLKMEVVVILFGCSNIAPHFYFFSIKENELLYLL